MSVEDFSVAAAVSWLTTIECRFENLLPNSSLTCLDFSSALDAHAGAADNHFLPPVPSFTSSPTYAEQVPVPERSCRFRFFVGKTLLPISLGQLSLKASQLPSGVEPVSHRFDETSIPSALVTLPVGAIPVPSLQRRSVG